MGFRDKLLDFKRRLSDRKMYSIVVVAIAAVAIWGLYQYKHAAQLRQQLDNQYNRAFYDMAGYVNNVEVLLMKSLITASPVKTAAILQEAWRQANLAQANLGQLPVSQPILANTAKFLTQVGDFSYALNNKEMQGQPLSDKEYSTIEKLYGFAVSLGKSLGKLQEELAEGRIKWGELQQKGPSIFRRTSSNLTMQQFENIDKTFQEYPTLIYDGPFSDHIAMTKPQGLTGDQVSVEEAKERVRNFFDKNKIKSIDYVDKTETEPFKTYNFRVSFKDGEDGEEALVSVTQKGGHVLWMLRDRPVGITTIDVDKAKAMGKKFLEDHGFNNMKDTYYLKEDNTAVINYAYSQDGVIVYPDLIKVKIALDNGEVVGFEAKSYLSSHTQRNLPAPGISMEEARAKINPRLEILDSGLAVIPTNFKTEIFAYEFKGRLNGKDFIVYINAENGREEDVLMILDTPNGILTM